MAIEDLKILYDNILIKALELDEEVTVKAKGGDVKIARPKQYEDKPEWAVVISAGQGRYLDNGELLPMSVQKGDVILFQKYSAQKFRLQGEDYIIIREDDIHAVYRG